MATLCRGSRHVLAQRIEEGGRFDGVHGVQPQAVEPVFVDPHARIGEEELAHRRLVEIDGRAPRGADVVAEEPRRDGVEMVSLRPEMVVDHVEQHHQPEPMRLVHQRLERFRRAIGRGWRERHHAVVAPVAPARTLGHRHQLDRGDPQRCQPWQLCTHAVVATADTNVQLIDHRLAPGAAPPAAVLPAVAVAGKRGAGAIDALGLPARRRVRHRLRAIDAEPVAGAGNACDVHGVEAIGVARHRMHVAIGQHQFHARCGRRPQPEAVAVADLPRAPARNHVGVAAGHASGTR